FAALGHLHRRLGFVARPLGHVLDLVRDIIPLKHLTKDNVAAIKPAEPDLVHVAIQKEETGVCTNLVIAVVMKNWEPLVSFPAFAIPVITQGIIRTYDSGLRGLNTHGEKKKFQ